MLVARPNVDPQAATWPYCDCDRGEVPTPGPLFPPGTTQGLSGMACGLGCDGGGLGVVGEVVAVVAALFLYDWLRRFWRPGE